MSEVFAIGLRLHGRPVLVVGGGEVAALKAERLLAQGARVTVVAPQLCPMLAQWSQQGALSWLARAFAATDVDGQFLVITCTGRNGIDALVFAACEARQTFCTAADVPESSSAWWMAQRQEGRLLLAVSTTASAPGLSRRLLDDARHGLPADAGDCLDRYAALRRWLADEHAPGEAHLERRTDALRWLASRRWQFFGLPWSRQTQLLAARYALGRTAVPR